MRKCGNAAEVCNYHHEMANAREGVERAVSNNLRAKLADALKERDDLRREAERATFALKVATDHRGPRTLNELCHDVTLDLDAEHERALVAENERDELATRIALLEMGAPCG
jgi:hypothetical protein